MSETQAEHPDTAATGDDASVPDLSETVSAIEVELTFEIGRERITLSKLNTLQSGYIFELPAKTTSPVTVIANGKPVGRGELLDVEGRIGVRLMESENG